MQMTIYHGNVVAIWPIDHEVNGRLNGMVEERFCFFNFSIIFELSIKYLKEDETMGLILLL
jgi:hypothetical protein